MAWPYEIPEEAATVLAQICCVNNQLAQGAPTSPVVSNMLCGKLDSELRRLAWRFRCEYTRYVDDITFSIGRDNLPAPIGRLIRGDEVTTAVAGDLLRETIERNGFTVNSSKTRIQRKGTRQEVTGLVVNRSPNVKRAFVRQIRAMIHSLDKFGLEAAEVELHSKYYTKQIHPKKEKPPFLSVLYGKLNYLKMVKGESDYVFRRLFNYYLKALKQPKKYITDPLQDVPGSLVILESSDPVGQGTGFAMKGFGLVTCHHVLQKGMNAFANTNITDQRPITIINSNADLDIALLVKPFPELTELEMGNPEALRIGDRIILAGFPNYRKGDSPYVVEGRVASFRTVSTLKWILISTPIVAGCSGGAVLDQSGRVIGIAATGTDRIESSGLTEHHGVIPITAIAHLVK